jgi:hypothetical protein
MTIMAMVLHKLLVTGSCGLIGSEICPYFWRYGFKVSV